jgi:predicted RND superfamily exporter protein
LKTTRFIAITTNSKPGVLKHQLKDMHEARSTVIELGVLDIRAITTEYAYLAREERMWTYTKNTIMKTLLGVFIISSLFLEPWLSILTTFSVFMVVVALFGTMAPAFWDIKLNVSSFINLVLAIGFAVDYSAHIAEGYMVKGHHGSDATAEEESHSQGLGGRGSTSGTTSSHASPPTSPSKTALLSSSRPLGMKSSSMDFDDEKNKNNNKEEDGTTAAENKKPILAPKERVHETMTELGGSVLNGGLSTLLGVLVLAFSESSGFRTLFEMFLSMVVFGLLHGLVFLPCVIYLVALALDRKNNQSTEGS